MKIKTCKICREDLSIESFTFQPDGKYGVHTICKKCDAKRKRDYYDEHKEHILERTKAYIKARPEIKRKTVLSQKAKFPEKYHARSIFHVALKRGDIEKPDQCSNCGAVSKLNAHHPDYTKPLYVIWYCVNCHARRHREMREHI